MFPKTKPSWVYLAFCAMFTLTTNAQVIPNVDSVLIFDGNGGQQNVYGESLIKVSKSSLNGLQNNSILSLDSKIAPSISTLEASKVALIFNEKLSPALINELSDRYGLVDIDESLTPFNIIEAAIPPALIKKIAAEPSIRFVDVKRSVSHMNYSKNTILHQSHLLAENPEGVLQGRDVVVGIGDGGSLKPHLDLSCNTIDLAGRTLAGYGDHANHVAGIIAGKGLVDNNVVGIAPASSLLMEASTDIVVNAIEYAETYGMTLSNNSYGVNLPCADNSDYNYMSGVLDELSHKVPDLLHVFAAGNSGLRNCSNYELGYGNLLKFYCTAKNVLTVGNVDDDLNISITSSKGPTFDGRLKPEVTAVGDRVISTGANNGYFESSGTSMAAPIVTGVLALMTEAYKNKFLEQPRADLLKAIVCNSSADKGLKGPDFAYGFGVVNANDAVAVINENQFGIDSLKKGGNTKIKHENTSSAPLKIMLYWNDLMAKPYADKALINDLDLVVVSPSGERFYPLVADPRNPSFAAKQGVDTINNVEQVVIDDPEIGTYTIQVNGSKLTSNQTFVYTTFQKEEKFDIVFPRASTELPAGQRLLVHWSAPYNPDDSFQVTFKESKDSKEKVLARLLGANQRTISWSIPNSFTQSGVLMIENLRTKEVLSLENLHIIPIIEKTAITRSCGQAATLSWEPIEGAIDYEVSTFSCSGLQKVANAATSFVNLNVGLHESFFFITPIFESGAGFQSPAMIKPLETTVKACDGTLELVQVDLPTLGREMTSTSLSEKLVRVLMKNQNEEAIELQSEYQLGEELQVVATSLSANNIETIDAFVFPSIAAGIHQFKGLFSYKGGEIVFEQTLTQLPNKHISLPFEEDLTDVSGEWYDVNTIGLKGINRWDATVSDGEVHTFDGLAMVCFDNETKQSVTGTYNLDGITNLKLHLVFGASGDGTAELEFRVRDDAEWTTLGDLVGDTFEADFQENFSTSTQFRIRSNHSTFKLKKVVLTEPKQTQIDVVQDNAKIKWTINNDDNIDYYVIQQAKADDFETIDVVDAYSQKELPIFSFKTGAIIRVVAVMKNGDKHMSEVIKIHDSLNIELVNLARNQVLVSVGGKHNIDLVVFSTNGNIMYDALLNPINQKDYLIEVSAWAPGIYIFNFNDGFEQRSLKVVKP